MKYLLIIAILLTGCQKKKEWTKPTSDDFSSLSGKDLDAWNYVQTKEDLEYLSFYTNLYEVGKGLLNVAHEAYRIPQSLHFVWIGPRPFPRESVENVRTWMAKHPGWTVNFWTDRERPLPVPGMKKRMISDLSFLRLKDCFNKSDNFAEKSDLLRCEILYQEGGIYVDHDVKCFKPFDSFNQAYDFYCGIDMPYTSSLPSCIYTTNNLIGSCPSHPIMLRCMDLTAQKWDKIAEDYPGADRDAMLNRVLHRTFWVFGEAIKELANVEQTRDIVFPAYYFDAPKDELALFARHQYAGSWHETESSFEKMVRQRLMVLSKKSNKMFLCFGMLSFLNFLGFIFLYRKVARRLT